MSLSPPLPGKPTSSAFFVIVSPYRPLNIQPPNSPNHQHHHHHQQTNSDFNNIQEPLLGVVLAVTLLLRNKLGAALDELHAAIRSARCGSVAGALARSSRPHLIRATSGSDSDSDPAAGAGAGADGDASTAGGSTANEDDAVPPLATAASGRLSKVSSRRLCTEAMLQVLQQEIRNSRRRSVELSASAGHLLVTGTVLGRGGYGKVMLGEWQRRLAAVKVMHARHDHGDAVTDAMEMAVLLTLQHPNIVSVYACLTDMVEEAPAPPPLGNGGELAPAACTPVPAAAAGPRFRRLLPGDGDVATCNIVVMEYCDRGTLADAVRGRARLFHRPLPGGAVGVDLAAVVDVLVEIAGSLAYMHRCNLLHGDVKLDNVLLKSDPTHALGVAPKLADFGLTKILKSGADGDSAVINHSGAGTVTHLAPELFTAGSRITAAVDVYALGVTMWEFYTAKRPYAGLARDAIVERVLKRGARPAFPPGAPADYVALATRCWASAPEERPAVADVCAALAAMQARLAAEAAAAEAEARAASASLPLPACDAAAVAAAAGARPASPPVVAAVGGGMVMR